MKDDKDTKQNYKYNEKIIIIIRFRDNYEEINRPFPNYLWPLFQSECCCLSFHMKISFSLHVNENQFSHERMSTKTKAMR